MMQMKLCSRCKKRVAVIYVTKTENGQTTSEGLCLRCAKELGIKPMNDIIRKLGISEEEFDAMADEVAGMIPFAEPQDENDNEGRAPALDFNAIMGGGGLPVERQTESAPDCGYCSSDRPIASALSLSAPPSRLVPCKAVLSEAPAS